MLAGEGQALAVRLLLAEPADLVAAGVMDGDLAVLLYCQPPVVGEICRAHVILCTLAGGRAEVGGPIGVLGRAVFGREELQMATWALPPGGASPPGPPEDISKRRNGLLTLLGKTGSAGQAGTPMTAEEKIPCPVGSGQGVSSRPAFHSSLSNILGGSGGRSAPGGGCRRGSG